MSGVSLDRMGFVGHSLGRPKRGQVKPPRLDDPVIDPSVTIASLTDRIAALATRERGFIWWYLALIPCSLAALWLVVSLVYLFVNGIGVWGLNWPVMWGFAILSYVWWIAIASGGTIISALFYLVRVDWRTSINRIAETMMLFGAAAAGIYPIIHLGRPWFAYWLFFYPSTMGTWEQFRSPLVWDFWALYTYVLTSIMFWYTGLLPDLATMRDRATTRIKQVLYGFFAMGYRGSSRQWKHLYAMYSILAAIMAPVVVSIHSCVGLDFAGAATIGWHSTQFPPFFVFGALLSAFAIVLLLIIPLRRLMRLETVITGRHLDVLCRLLLASSLCLAYSYLMDAFTTYYGNDKAEHVMFRERVFGYYSYVYWATICFNVSLPQLFWFRRLRMIQPVVLVISLGVVIGMWFERYEIVVTSLHRPHIPSAWGVFHGTFWDWSTLIGTVGLFLTGLLVAIRFLPVISLHEMRSLVLREADRRAR
jgi:molybdopterin-containing oxidoreductase family membrane subunit